MPQAYSNPARVKIEVAPHLAKPVASLVASCLEAIDNCKRSGNAEWEAKHRDRVQELVSEFMPSGSGWDEGTKLDWDKSTPDRLVFFGSFHHMDEGSYDGWTEHTITVKPSLAHGFTIVVSGRNRNDIKDYLAEMFHGCLSEPVTHYWADAESEAK
jgi:hypothetical protein